ARHPYPRWVSTLAWGGMAAFITLLLGGTGWVPFISFVISAVVDRLGRLLNKYALPFFFQQVAGGFVATTAAITVVNLDIFDLERPTLVVSAALTVLLSGLSTVSAVQDAITGYYVTAAGRMLEVVFMSAGLITGVGAAISMATRFGATRAPDPTVATPGVSALPIMARAGSGAAACFALASCSKVRPLLVAAAPGAVGAAAYGALNILVYDPIIAALVGTTLVGVGGGVVARRLKVTPLV